MSWRGVKQKKLSDWPEPGKPNRKALQSAVRDDIKAMAYLPGSGGSGTVFGEADRIEAIDFLSETEKFALHADGAEPKPGGDQGQTPTADVTDAAGDTPGAKSAKSPGFSLVALMASRMLVETTGGIEPEPSSDHSMDKGMTGIITNTSGEGGAGEKSARNARLDAEEALASDRQDRALFEATRAVFSSLQLSGWTVEEIGRGRRRDLPSTTAPTPSTTTAKATTDKDRLPFAKGPRSPPASDGAPPGGSSANARRNLNLATPSSPLSGALCARPGCGLPLTAASANTATDSDSNNNSNSNSNNNGNSNNNSYGNDGGGGKKKTAWGSEGVVTAGHADNVCVRVPPGHRFHPQCSPRRLLLASVEGPLRMGWRTARRSDLMDRKGPKMEPKSQPRANNNVKSSVKGKEPSPSDPDAEAELQAEAEDKRISHMSDLEIAKEAARLAGKDVQNTEIAIGADEKMDAAIEERKKVLFAKRRNAMRRMEHRRAKAAEIAAKNGVPVSPVGRNGEGGKGDGDRVTLVDPDALSRQRVPGLSPAADAIANRRGFGSSPVTGVPLRIAPPSGSMSPRADMDGAPVLSADDRLLYPIGYASERLYRSTRVAGRKCLFTSTITQEDIFSDIVFTVTARPPDAFTAHGNTPSEAWEKVTRAVEDAESKCVRERNGPEDHWRTPLSSRWGSFAPSVPQAPNTPKANGDSYVDDTRRVRVDGEAMFGLRDERVQLAARYLLPTLGSMRESHARRLHQRKRDVAATIIQDTARRHLIQPIDMTQPLSRERVLRHLMRKVSYLTPHLSTAVSDRLCKLPLEDLGRMVNSQELLRLAVRGTVMDIVGESRSVEREARRRERERRREKKARRNKGFFGDNTASDDLSSSGSLSSGSASEADEEAPDGPHSEIPPTAGFDPSDPNASRKGNNGVGSTAGETGASLRLRLRVLGMAARAAGGSLVAEIGGRVMAMGKGKVMDLVSGDGSGFYAEVGRVTAAIRAERWGDMGQN